MIDRITLSIRSQGVDVTASKQLGDETATIQICKNNKQTNKTFKIQCTISQKWRL